MEETRKIFHPNPQTLPVSAITGIYETNLATGLDSNQVTQRQAKFGLNEIKEDNGPILLVRIWQELLNPLILVLVGALFFTIYLGEVTDTLVIALAIIINITIALYQEGRAKNIFATLNQQQAKNARVIRSSVEKIIPASDLVPGDVIMISSGESIPADIRVVEADSAQADEAILTGEWEVVDKSPEPNEKNTALAEQSSIVFAGTLLANGFIKGVVVATGLNSEFGQLASATKSTNELTPLQKQLKRLAYFISAIVVLLSIIIVLIGMTRGVPTAEIVLISIAIAVSAVPEGLPSAITAILAVGMRHILEKDGLVKSLLAAETLGTTDVIITDKTGTLTEGRMSLVSLIPAFSTEIPSTDEVVMIDEHQEVLLRSALLCSDGFLTTSESGELVANGRPIEKALVQAGLRMGFNRADLNNDDEELDFLPFASERRFSAVLVEGKHGHYAILSGAPEYMVSHANFFYDGDGEPSLMTDFDRARLGDLQTKLASRGHRLTGVARVPIEAHRFDELDGHDILKSLGKKLEFVGYIGFSDPVRGDVPVSIRLAQEAGARVLVATGDNRNTALAIANQAGVTTDNTVIEGKDLIDLDDDAIYELFLKTSVFARMRPTQKKRLASVLQARGHVVAMTGDGINDAPALASADVGIAVYSGTDVAKSAADLILLKNSFATIVSAIQEGRRLLDNIRRVVVHRISAGFGEVLIVMSSLLLAAPVPILPKQILWINIIQGGLLTFAYAFEPADPEVMKRKPNEAGSKGIMNRQVKILLTLSSLSFGLISLAVYLLSYFQVLVISFEDLRTLIFAVLTIDVIVFSFALKDFNRPIWRIKLLSNKVLVLAVALSFGLFICSMLLPFMREFLSLTTLSWSVWLVIIIVAAIELALVELAKYIARPKNQTNDSVVLPT